MSEPLHARTRALPTDRPLDLLELAGGAGMAFVRDGVGLAGHGIACRGERSQILAELAAALVHDEVDRPGTGPVAFGSLPFLPGAPAELVVPELTIVVDPDGARWVTAVGSSDRDPVELLERLESSRSADPVVEAGPSSFTVTAARTPEDWQAAVAAATARIRSGELDKVVLAREVTVTADQDLSVATILRRLADRYPGCFAYLVDGFCGASPELLVSRHGDRVQAQPMAGTAPRRGDPDADAKITEALAASATYRHEHQVTIDAVHDTLLGFSSYVDYEPEPQVVALANVFHLATTVDGKLSHPPASVLELVDALHPTPAVCGRPAAAAQALIAELEQLERGPYAGAVGWVDAAGNGQWAVAIRGAEIAGRTARVIAGNGMVGDSDPATELVETRAKLQAMLAAIIQP